MSLLSILFIFFIFQKVSSNNFVLESDRSQILDKVHNIFIYSDDIKNYGYLLKDQIFSSRIIVDYTSLYGGRVEEYSVEEMIDQWTQRYKHYDYTHHQIGNVRINFLTNKEAVVYCYGTLYYYMEKNEKSEAKILNVIGSFEMDVAKMNKEWRMTTIKFNLKFKYGDEDLLTLGK